MLSQIKHQLIALLDYFRYKSSYAQDGEDIVLLSFFENEKYYQGFYIDVGAHHPVRFSNTWAFYRRGWHGVNIDPTPGSMRMFNYLRSSDINLEIGVGQQIGELIFYCFNEPALNTFDHELAQRRNVGEPYRIVKEVKVQIMPLSHILDAHLKVGQKIDFLTVDVEGLDLEVLRSNDWAKYTPQFILVEDPEFIPTEPYKSAIYCFLYKNRYDVISILKRTIIYKLIDKI